MLRIPRRQVVAFRLATQHLSRHLRPDAMGHATACGLQDAPTGAAVLMLAARVDRVTPGDVEHALLADRTLVQLRCMRQELHLVSAPDVPLFVAALPLADAPTPRAELPLQPARHQLLRRYLRWFGPSAPGDFAAWAGITLRQSHALWSDAGVNLVRISVDDRETYLAADDLRLLERAPSPPALSLVAPHDPYLQARDRGVAVPDTTLHARIWGDDDPRGVVLRHGQVAALWRHASTPNRWNLLLEEVLPLAPADYEAVEAEARRLAPFVGRTTVDVTVAPTPS